MLGLHAKLNEVGNPVDDRPRFSGPGAGDDKMWSLDGRGSFVLLRVQLILVIDLEALWLNKVKLTCGFFDCVFFHVAAALLYELAPSPSLVLKSNISKEEGNGKRNGESRAEEF